MAGGWWIGFGIFFILVGIGMIIGAVVWEKNSSAGVWTNGMIWLLAAGIIIGILGIILFGVGLYYYSTTPSKPIISAQIQVFDPLLEDNVPVKTLLKRCSLMSDIELRDVINKYPETYGTYCEPMLQDRLRRS